MSYRMALSASLAAALFVGGGMAASALKSGPEVGSSKITPFNPQNVTGKWAGTKTCLV